MKRTEHFTGKVPASLDVAAPDGLITAVTLIVPESKRRRVLGYRLSRISPILGNTTEREVTITVTYQ